MPRGVEESFHFTGSEHRQIIFSARTQACPGIDYGQGPEQRSNLESVSQNRVHTARGDLFSKACMLRSRASQHTTIQSRHQVTTRTVEDVTREARIRLKTNHLSAHWFDAHSRQAFVALFPSGDRVCPRSTGKNDPRRTHQSL